MTVVEKVPGVTVYKNCHAEPVEASRPYHNCYVERSETSQPYSIAIFVFFINFCLISRRFTFIYKKNIIKYGQNRSEVLGRLK